MTLELTTQQLINISDTLKRLGYRHGNTDGVRFEKSERHGIEMYIAIEPEIVWRWDALKKQWGGHPIRVSAHA